MAKNKGTQRRRGQHSKYQIGDGPLPHASLVEWKQSLAFTALVSKRQRGSSKKRAARQAARPLDTDRGKTVARSSALISKRRRGSSKKRRRGCPFFRPRFPNTGASKDELTQAAMWSVAKTWWRRQLDVVETAATTMRRSRSGVWGYGGGASWQTSRTSAA